MSHIAFDLDALPLVPKVARAASLADGVVAWGLLQMWEWCWREKVAEVSDIHLRGFFGADVGETLAAFGFLEKTGRVWRVRGAARYLRIQEGRSKGGRAAAGNLKQNQTAGSPPAGDRLATGSPPADSPAADRAFSDKRAATSEQRQASSEVPGTPLAVAWNESTTLPLPRVTLPLSPVRASAAAAALGRRPLDVWRTVFKRINSSTFLRGADGGWKADFDWAIRPEGKKPEPATRVLEGAYDRQTGPPPRDEPVEHVAGYVKW